MKPNLFILYFLFFSCSSFAAEENPDFSSFRGVLENHFSSRQENFDPDNTFFKKLDISSNDHSPLKNSQPYIQKVLRDEDVLHQKSEGVFSFSDSLDVDLKNYLDQFLDPSKDQVSVNIQGQPLLFKPTETIKNLFVDTYKNRKELEEKIPKGYWRQTVVWQGNLAPLTPSSLSGQIEIHIQHAEKHPMSIRSMAVCLDKIQRKTKIFFDVCDPNNPSEELPLFPEKGIVFNYHEHKEESSKKCLRVKKNKIYKTSVSRTTYSLFPDDQTGHKWIQKDDMFIKVSTQKEQKLPLSYQEWDFEGERIEGIAEDRWLLTSLTDKYFHAIPKGKTQSSCLYVYHSKQEQLFAVQLWKEKWKNLTNDLEQDVTYLQKTPYPLALQENAVINGHLKEGYYEVSPLKEKEIWRHLGSDEEPQVEFSDSKGSLKALPYPDKKHRDDHKKTLELLVPLRDKTFIQDTDWGSVLLWGSGITAVVLACKFRSDLLPYLKEGIQKLPDLSKWANTLSALKK